MKVDYNLIMKQQISSLGYKPRLLLHCCCAPCSSAVIERIKQYFDITFYYYNPNIYPQLEYDKRVEEFIKLGVEVINTEYDHNEFLTAIKGKENCAEGGERCQKCIEFRMRKSFQYAKENSFDYVSTTLSISPHKDCYFINSLGNTLSKEYNIKYLFADFKKENGYLRSIQICKEKQIYRQDYCGCEFGFRPNKD